MNGHNKRSNTDKNDLRPNNIDKGQLPEQNTNTTMTTNITSRLPLITQIQSNTLNIRDAIGSSDLSVKKSQNSNRTLRVRTSRSNTQADLNNKTINPPTKQLPSAKSNGMRSFKHINKLKS
ncbi:uncharacterized protein OCT59_001113 [Rhizophagus irregularis]|uniref:Uncharacterized protein n=1 Tax=Rhizophagus irregularis (strain DAOM 197198w) TaxID=1432141 RepID=A0A015KMJ8_RHIIW|nr:hypothetical protein RirG_102540 [Rhizophagus irregularis DAOM 197198w]UZN99848.1 hypothetical protein OCT59_001113 [Rhizophagus irregularis]GBC28810.2 hypothetical protein RIR_jg10857.t1 [Rhizophagus irregularis DAOM 181602=DAOM 197198]